MSRRSAASLSTRSLTALPLRPVSLLTDRAQDVPRGPAAVERRVGVLEDHLDRALVGGRAAGGRVAASAWSSSSRVPPASGLSMPRIVLASVDLPEPDSPTRPSVSPSNSSRSDLDQGRHVVAALVERLRHVRRATSVELAVDRVLADDRRRLDDLAEAVAMVAAGPAAAAPTSTTGGSTVRHSSVGERAAIDEDAGRQVRPDLRQVARGSSTAPAATCGCRGAAASAGGRACTDAPGARRRPRRRPPRRSCRRTSRRPGRTASG